jgi:Trk-type K+ transport system membrane component
MLGTVLLSFPNCIYEEGSLSLIDALFISTSATCVTGLCPVDFPVVFTQYGQIIVLFLIQIGGLGIITITSFFALSIMGAIPFRSTLMIKDFIMESNSSNISGLLHRVIYTTLAIEAIGAIFIYFTLRNQLIIPKGELLYFSVFHSISAFCNAGFSIWPGGLCTPDLIQNNYFYYIISALIILGGIGFPIYSNLFKIISTRIKDTICMIKKRHYTKTLHSWDLNSIIVIKVTAILLLFSTAYFLIFEWNGILNGLSISQKIAQAFFNAVLPRTAGFSSQDISSLSPLTFIVIILLMWIGGAPQSTAGGIKVTSFYLMIKNSLALLTERGKLESNKREISRISVQRAFASIFLTTLTIFAGCILLMFTEDGIQVHRLLFEVVSAIGTVGSSMNVTPELSNIGKVIITVIMFIGRIGIITFITSFIHHKKTPYYRYPEGHIIVS